MIPCLLSHPGLLRAGKVNDSVVRRPSRAVIGPADERAGSSRALRLLARRSAGVVKRLRGNGASAREIVAQTAFIKLHNRPAFDGRPNEKPETRAPQFVLRKLLNGSSGPRA